MSSPFDGAWTLQRLLAAERRGDHLKFVAFWGHRPRRPGEMDSHVLSQWFPHAFEAEDGLHYPTAEHFMMAAKARLFGDDHVAERIMQSPTPEEAKDLGRQVSDFDAAVWEVHRLDIVRSASLAKFGSCLKMRSYLVGTGFRVLVEASPVDRIWGIGADRASGIVERPSLWRGQNLLGFALMSARAELAVTVAPASDCATCAASSPSFTD